MTKDRNLSSIDRYWATANLCALLVGVGIRLALSNTAENPILNDMNRFPAVSHLAHHLFYPLTYVAVAVLFALGIIRLKCVGLWSVCFAFILGGISATIFLALR
jgi:hypothetical protein